MIQRGDLGQAAAAVAPGPFPAEALASAALALAKRFAAGATMWCVAPEWPAHARHLAVEFVHPVAVGSRALPAVAAVGPDTVATLQASVRAGDLLVAVASAHEPVVADLIECAAVWGLETFWIGSGDERPTTRPDHLLWINDTDPLAPQGAGPVLVYHVLWEMTHVCLQHPGLLSGPDTSVLPVEPTGFLYPFIEADEHDGHHLIVDLAASAAAKAAESTRLRHATLEGLAHELDTIAGQIARRAVAGGVVLTFGNGGSATDALSAASLFAHPPVGTAIGARGLAEDPAVLTALANDVGFARVFSRQIMAHGRDGDVAVGLSTSGDSANLLEAFAEARRLGMLTVALVGGGGGRCATDGAVDHCLVVDSASVHRTQETQAAVIVALWRRVQDALGVAMSRTALTERSP